MKLFWLRFSIFILLWGLLIVQHSEHIAVSILFMTIATAFYFFLSLYHVPLLLYIVLSLVTASHVFFLTDYFYTVILLIFLSVFAMFQLKKRNLIIYLITNFICIASIVSYQSGRLFELLIIYGWIVYLIIALEQYVKAREKQRDQHEQLLSDYRQLKRMNVSGERAARLEERTRIARDLHDSVGHRLTALIMKLEILAIQKNDANFRELKQMAEESLAETREAVSVLQTEDNEGIATVVQLIRKLESESHILVQFTLKQGVLTTRLSNENNIRLYRVIQEALTNAMRHAHSREVRVSLGMTATGEVSFEIRNRVYDPQPFEFGFGLENMKRRIKDMGGHLSVFQTDDEFAVQGSFPIGEED